MTDKQSEHYSRFALLRELTLSASEGKELTSILQASLAEATDVAGLSAASVLIWDRNNQVRHSASVASSDASGKRLRELEEQLFSQLRFHQSVVSAYLSFGGPNPVHSFTLPLRHGELIFGAVIGLQSAEKRPFDEHLFLEAFAAAVSLFAIVDQTVLTRELSADQTERERLGAIMETAVTVNHEINNPLTAILGNVQLLLLKRRELDPELETKLRIIEQAALKIRDVTQRLLQVRSSKSTSYTEGTSMLDLSDTDPK